MELAISDVKKIVVSDIRDNLGETKVRRIEIEHEKGIFEIVLMGKEEGLKVKEMGSTKKL